jgi:modulator of FtsH protease HflK
MTASPSSHARPATGHRHWRHTVAAALPAVAALAWLLSGFYTVGTDQTGLVTRFGRLVDQRVDAGLHYAWPWPIERVYTPRTTDVRSIDVGFTTLGQAAPEARSSDTLTGDENILKIMLVVQYKIRDPAAFLFHVEDPHWLVERTVESALSTLVAALPVDDVLTTAKDEIQVRVIARAQEMLDAHESGLVLLGGNLQVVDPPVPVGAAFKEVASAKKDSERLLDEAREYEGRVLPEARGQAERVLSAAQGAHADRLNQARGEAARFMSVLAEYRRAPEVTRARLYVESMERLLGQMEVIVLDRSSGAGASKITIVE